MRIILDSGETKKFNLDEISFGQRVTVKTTFATERKKLKEHIYREDYDTAFYSGNQYQYIKSIEDDGITYCIFTEKGAYNPSTLVLNKHSCEEFLIVDEYIYPYKNNANLIDLYKNTFIKLDKDKYENCKARILSVFIPLAQSIYGKGNYTFSEKHGVITFYLKFPKIIVSNKDKAAKLIRDLCIRFKVSCIGEEPLIIESLQGTRATYTKVDWETYYRHSHLEANITSKYTNFCLGESAIVQLTTRLRSKFDESIFEAFLSQLPEHMSYESIEGTPYTYLSNCQNYKKESGDDIYNQAQAIAKDLLSNPESDFDSRKLIKEIKLNEDCNYSISFHNFTEVRNYLSEIVSSNITIKKPYSSLLGSYVEIRPGYEKGSKMSDKIEWGDDFIPITKIPTEEIDIKVEAMSLGINYDKIDASIALPQIYSCLLSEIENKFNSIKNRKRDEYNKNFSTNIQYGSITG